MIERRLMQFWHDDNLPPHVQGNALAFEDAWPLRSVTLLDDTSAFDFLCAHYDREHADLFLSCQIPAMRSDLIRYAWLYKSGGMYLDAKFAPLEFPKILYREGWDLTCERLDDYYNIRNNGILAAPAGSPIVGTLVSEAFAAVRERRQGSIGTLTGPGLLADVTRKHTPTEAVRVIKRGKLTGRFLVDRRVEAWKKNGIDKNHWSFVEKEIDLYR